MSDVSNLGETEYWRSAQQWVDHQDVLDALLQPVLDRLLSQAAIEPGHCVLDIGCGTGASTMAAAERVSRNGHVLGVDVSAIMLELAQSRVAATALENVAFLEGDAQICDLGHHKFDVVMSRFGVMFFGDPVAAFANIARAAKPGAQLVFLAWSGLAENPWFDLPRQAAIEVLGAPPPADPRAPGPMAFADEGYVAAILSDAGWQDIVIDRTQLDLTPKGTVSDVASFATHLGPASRIIKDLQGTDTDAREIEGMVAKSLAPYDTASGVRVPAVLNLVQARA